MRITDKVAALLAGLTGEEVDALPPAHRERFAQLLQHWADFARIRPQPPKSGVLLELKLGRDG
jgi:hypothetical protein